MLNILRNGEQICAILFQVAHSISVLVILTRFILSSPLVNDGGIRYDPVYCRLQRTVRYCSAFCLVVILTVHDADGKTDLVPMMFCGIVTNGIDESPPTVPVPMPPTLESFQSRICDLLKASPQKLKYEVKPSDVYPVLYDTVKAPKISRVVVFEAEGYRSYYEHLKSAGGQGAKVPCTILAWVQLIPAYYSMAGKTPPPNVNQKFSHPRFYIIFPEESSLKD